MYEISARWPDLEVGEYLFVNEIEYLTKIVWRGGTKFNTIYSADLRDEDALYLTLTYTDVVATRLDK